MLRAPLNWKLPALLFCLCTKAAFAAGADLIVTNARIYTVDEARPRAAALAVKDGRVAFVGSEREALALRGPSTRLVDAHGNTVIPGMVDAHAHLLGLGLSLEAVKLAGTRSYDEVIRRVVERAREIGFHKMVLAAFPFNDRGMKLYERHGFRTVGVYKEQGMLDGKWVDVILMEKILG